MTGFNPWIFAELESKLRKQLFELMRMNFLQIL
jgi:hypothetical protein